MYNNAFPADVEAAQETPLRRQLPGSSNVTTRFFDIFTAQHNSLVIGYLLGTQFFEFLRIFCLWQLFKEVDWLILPHLFSNPHNLGLE